MVLPVVVALQLLAAAPLALSVSITDIQGPAFLSPLLGQTVRDITGIVTAVISDSGFYIQGNRTDDVRVSNGLLVFTESSSILNKVSVGDLISLSGKVAEFKESSEPNDLLGTELDDPTDIVVLSSGNTVEPLVLGQDRSPPTEKLSALDIGPDGWLSVPNNVSLIDSVNATLQPDLFGIDFWSSLEGQLVTVPSPVALDFQDSFNEFWVRGDWPASGLNSRGGLTITELSDGLPDGNPETVIIGDPIDGTTNPTTSVGMTFSDITGVVQFQFGFYYILPLTAPTVLAVPSADIPSATIAPSDDACTITIGDYNVENMAPTSTNLPPVANHIANFLNLPDIMFLQEIQDNDGEVDDGVVDANVTLTTLTDAIASASSSGFQYAFFDIDPVNDQDGGAGGGNIRQAHLYRSEKLNLVPGSPVGGSLDATEPITSDGQVTLSFNPGRIDPTNSSWDDSRKPLATAWETSNGERFFTVNLHLVAKTGDTSESVQGNARPPVNTDVAKRTSQVEIVAAFVKQLLALDPNASIIVGGDCNDFVQTRSVFAAFDDILTELDVNSNVPLVERYTYVFQQSSQQLDHLFVSSAIAARGTEIQHIHVNNWGPSLATRASDHDPSVAQVKVC
ncbi:DNase I-like protein [Obba rivulosa]|uniref:DNase I-like protein n=1 Tax=Obba rivulosa TaxID=1052685 RepID=A0A8E2APH5_9APHY|nr:DNase I-like protein [Obba rivulosa]